MFTPNSLFLSVFSPKRITYYIKVDYLTNRLTRSVVPQRPNTIVMYLPVFIQLFVFLLGYICYRSFRTPNVEEALGYAGLEPIIGYDHLFDRDTARKLFKYLVGK